MKNEIFRSLVHAACGGACLATGILEILFDSAPWVISFSFASAGVCLWLCIQEQKHSENDA